MNRRSFIATITALAGIVLARIKAPAPTAKWFRYPDKCPYCGGEGMSGYDTLCLCQPLKDAIDNHSHLL